MVACAAVQAQTKDLPHASWTITPPVLLSCALCGTRWQPATSTSAAPASSAPPPQTRRDGLELTRAPKLDIERRGGFRELAYRDNEPLINRLKRIQAVAFFTVWDSTAATIYVGVNRDGEPGLHLRQKKYDRGTLAPASRTLFSDVTPWRAAMRESSERTLRLR